MKNTIIARPFDGNTKNRPGLLDRMAKQAVLGRLDRIQHGAINLIDGDNSHLFGKQSDAFPDVFTVIVDDPAFYSDIAFAGSIGAGEAYMQGAWRCKDITGLMRLLLVNREVLDGMDSSWARLTAPIHKGFHWLHRNTRQGSRRNIEAHYDLGNEMFQLFLDPTMMYSCGIFETAHSSMEQASIAKLDRICKKLQLNLADHVLEIGTGWGGFAMHAAKHYGCQVTTTTISQEQYALAQERIESAGLSSRITVLLQDYRDVEGEYDKLVSIEMIEAIGHEYYDTFFQQCGKLLKPDGMMLLQAITIADQRYDAAKRSVDFIQRYIFPGSCIPSVTAMLTSMTKKSDMRLFHLEDIGPHYATTLNKWRQRFFDNIHSIKTLGYSDHFIRMWEFYLCYCEAGFLERAIGNVHMLLTKPQCHIPPITAKL